jgi:DNA polymerase-3 subunit delta
MADEKIYPVYLLRGKEPVLRAAALTALVNRLTDPAFRDFDLERIPARGATAEQILGAAAAVPFGSPRKVTIIEDAQRLAADVLEKLKKLLPSQLGPGAALIFVAGEAGDGEKAQGAMQRLAGIAKNLGVVQTFDPLERGRVGAWLAGAAKERGVNLDGGARAELTARVGSNLGALERELDKLAAYTAGRGTVSRADVEAVVPESTEYSIFHLVDAVSEGRTADALRVLHGVRANNEPAQRIMPLLARQIRLVWQAKMLADERGAADRLPNEPNLLKMAPFVQEKTRRQARNMSWPRLRRGLRLLLDKDLALKGVEGPPVGDDEALETLVVGLCG